MTKPRETSRRSLARSRQGVRASRRTVIVALVANAVIAVVKTFMAAVSMFLAGATFAVGYGVTELLEGGEDSGGFAIAWITLVVAALAEGISWLRALRQTRREARQASLPLLRHVRQSRDPNVKMVLFEDSAALLGVAIAAVGVGLHQSTGSGVFPFVGPAGRELDRALERAGLPRADVYVTNVVKHFKFEERGRRRFHQTPKRADIDACPPCLRAEMHLLEPAALVLLGATASKALLGSSFRLTQRRGEALESDLAPLVTATIHPSAILRQRDDAARHAERRAFTADLQVVAGRLAGSA